MNAREEKRAAFNEQMNEWVSRQGLWFQLRHAADGQTIVARLLRVFIRLFIILVIALFFLWLYLVKRVEGDAFNAKITTALEEVLAAENCEVGSIHKARDTITISSVKADGTAGSFFHKAAARVIRLNMGITDGVIGKWSADAVNITQLDLEVKAGDRDDAAAAKSFAALFAKYENFEFERIEVDVANIQWGYSETNSGSITNTTMSVVRNGDSWNIELSGGMFSQNWLRNLEIQKMIVVCDKKGIHIKEAKLRSGLGTVAFSLDMGSGGKPEANGTLQLTSMPLKALLPARYEDWLAGTISGKGKISGSTNSQEGIVMDIDFTLGEGDVMVLRDRLPLLSALSVVDLYNSYRKVSFDEGGFHIKTGGNRMEVSQVALQAGNLLDLKDGQFVVRPPTNKEIASALNIKDLEVVNKVIENKWKFEDDEMIRAGTSGGELSHAARGVVGEVVQGKSDVTKVKDVLTTSILNESKVSIFEGSVQIGLNGDAFDKAEKLKAAYPEDEASGRIWVRVPLNGRLQTLTLKQARKFYIMGKNRL